jgi:hypothetical protein
MMRCANNGLVVLLVAMVAILPMQFPSAAVSAGSSPDWRWDEQGRVYDASGQYRVLTREETCKLFQLKCDDLPKISSELFAGDGGGSK